MLDSRKLLPLFLITVFGLAFHCRTGYGPSPKKVTGGEGSGSRSLEIEAEPSSLAQLTEIPSVNDATEPCHECSVGHLGARTYELIMGMPNDSKDSSFNDDFNRLIARGFPNPAFPPSTPDTVYSIPTGLAGTHPFDIPPTSLELPEIHDLAEAKSVGQERLHSKIQFAIGEIFQRMKPEDTFVLVISSHGIDTGGVFRFGVDYDLSYDYSRVNGAGEGTARQVKARAALALQDFDFSQCPSCTLMILADTCCSATMVSNMSSRLAGRTGNVILLGSAQNVAQDWQGAEGQSVNTDNGPVAIKSGGVFTTQFLDALSNPNLTGDIYSVVRAAAAKASAVANAWSLKRTSNPQTVTPWTRPIPTGEICPKPARAAIRATSP